MDDNIASNVLKFSDATNVFRKVNNEGESYNEGTYGDFRGPELRGVCIARDLRVRNRTNTFIGCTRLVLRNKQNVYRLYTPCIT